jgi:SAM-dependent methyltransferase
MKTVVFQSHRDRGGPAWRRRAMESVRAWAEGRGWDYVFIDDALFDLLPSWYRDKAAASVTIRTDLARLIQARRFLDAGHGRAVWVDADVFVFAPEHLTLPDDEAAVFCHEVWVHRPRAAGGGSAVTIQANNAVCAFLADDTRFLDHYARACELILDRKSPPFTGKEVGTDYLMAVRRVFDLALIRSVGLFSPVVLADVLNGAGPITGHYMARMGAPLGAVNLCASMLGRPHDGLVADDALFDRLVERLGADGGAAVNRWAALEAQIDLARGEADAGRTDAARRVLLAAADAHPHRPEAPNRLAELAWADGDLNTAYRWTAQALSRDPFDAAAAARNAQCLTRAGAAPDGRAGRFAQIYRTAGWGRTEGRAFCSGPGSRPQAFAAYSAYVSDFIKTRGVRTVVDLGCGDGAVAAALDRHGASYVGVDVVEDVIAENRRTLGAPDMDFRCADIVADDLPTGDLCLIRQVLQHLSDADIHAVLAKLSAYRWVLVTDGQAPIPPERRRNIDKQTDHTTRASLFANGLWLELAPFEQTLSVVLESENPFGDPPGEILRTVLIENPAAGDQARASEPPPT